MALTKLTFRPGINREDTAYTNEGGWVDCDKVRFRRGYPEKIGGWTKKSEKSILGSVRSLHAFTALDGSNYIGMGSHLKFYIEEGGDYSDITPIRDTSDAGSMSFDATAGVLNGDHTADVKVISLNSSTGWPTSGRIKIDSEEMTYTGVSGNDLTGVTRGVNGTTAAEHLDDAAVNCATIIVTCTFHGAVQSDFVTITGATSLGGQITANVLNQEYQITEVPSSDTFYIEARAESTTIPSITVDGQLDANYVYATSSDTGSGGGSAFGTFQINMGLDTAILGTGWGSGAWGRDTWGSGTDLLVSTGSMRLWSQDNFGEDLLMSVRDGGIYYWDKSSGTGTRAVELSSLAGADATVPTVAKQIMVSDQSRHVIAFGCDGETTIGTQDPLLIRFSDQESLTEWASTATNTAGELRLGSGTQFVTAIETKQQTLIFTDTALYSMQYLGPPFTFGIDRISSAVTVMSPNSAVAVDDVVYWMGLEDFYLFNGRVQKVDCAIKSYIFDDFNSQQAEKVCAALNTSFNEVWWFYPSESSQENDRYAVYNYIEDTWAYGTLARTAWLDRGIHTHPLATGTDGYLYYHERGVDDGSTSPASAVTAYVESGDLDLADGDRFAFIDALLPDVTFQGSETSTPALTMTLKTRSSAGSGITQSGEAAIEKTATVPVEQFTERKSLRLRGRSFRLRIESTAARVGWRLGSPRIDVRPDGGR